MCGTFKSRLNSLKNERMLVAWHFQRSNSNYVNQALIYYLKTSYETFNYQMIHFLREILWGLLMVELRWGSREIKTTFLLSLQKTVTDRNFSRNWKCFPHSLSGSVNVVRRQRFIMFFWCITHCVRFKGFIFVLSFSQAIKIHCSTLRMAALI